MISHHDEIEAKLEAQKVDLQAFLGWAHKLEGIERMERCSSTPDDYYECGEAVVRHRGTEGKHELTVKRRKSNASTRDREEIDLHFADSTPHASVGAFLRATGYAHVLRLTKNNIYIFWVKPTPNITLVYCIYDVWNEDEKGSRRFIEVEAEKGSNVTPETAKRYLREAVAEMQKVFKPYLGEPVNESLWEIFSGKRYSSV
jgi:adenylate cyclase class IV